MYYSERMRLKLRVKEKIESFRSLWYIVRGNER